MSTLRIRTLAHAIAVLVPMVLVCVALHNSAAAAAAEADPAPETAIPAARDVRNDPRLQSLRDAMQAAVTDGRLAGVVTLVAQRGQLLSFDAVG